MPTFWPTVHPLILPEVPGCPTPTVDSALAASAADFCSRTHIWRENLAFQVAVRNVSRYPIIGTLTTPSPFTVIESVLWVVLDGTVLAHVDPRDIDQSQLTDTGKPMAFWLVNDTEVRLHPIPDTRYRMDITVALKPSRTAPSIEDWIYESYIETIVSGAIWRLSRIPGKTWSNPEIAMYHHRLFEQGVTNARLRDQRNVNKSVAQRNF